MSRQNAPQRQSLSSINPELKRRFPQSSPMPLCVTYQTKSVLANLPELMRHCYKPGLGGYSAEKEMARYFFDIEDGERKTRNQDGTELPNHQVMLNAATGILPDIAREEPLNGNRRTLIYRVRNEIDKIIFEARLSLDAGWTDGAGGPAG
jgi:hypothetical protein